MKKIDLGQTINTLANVGVIAGIIFLAFELRQNQRITMAQTRNDLTQMTIDIAQYASDERVIDVILKGNSGQPLSDHERFLFGRWANIGLRSAENVAYQYRQGLFDEEEYSASRENLRLRLRSQPGFRQVFCRTQVAYSRSFVASVSELLDEPCPEGLPQSDTGGSIP